jgi:hypothetical protein
MGLSWGTQGDLAQGRRLIPELLPPSSPDQQDRPACSSLMTPHLSALSLSALWQNEPTNQHDTHTHTCTPLSSCDISKMSSAQQHQASIAMWYCMSSTTHSAAAAFSRRPSWVLLPHPATSYLLPAQEPTSFMQHQQGIQQICKCAPTTVSALCSVHMSHSY